MKIFVLMTGFIVLALVLCLVILLIRRLSADERDRKDQRKIIKTEFHKIDNNFNSRRDGMLQGLALLVFITKGAFAVAGLALIVLLIRRLLADERIRKEHRESDK